MSTANTKIKVSDRVRVLYGEHAGKIGTVRGICPSGHLGYDLIAVSFAFAPVWVFECCLEVQPSVLVRAAQEWQDEVVKARIDARPTGRKVSFKVGQTVRVCNLSRTYHGEVGTILEVHDDPVAMDFVGQSGRLDILDGRYVIRFDLPDCPNEYDVRVFWDHELADATTYNPTGKD